MWDGGGGRPDARELSEQIGGVHADGGAHLAVFCVGGRRANYGGARRHSCRPAVLAMPSPADDLAELNRVAFMHEAVLFVLRGASVRKFGADGRKAPRTVTLRMDGANNRVVWHGSEAQVESVSGDMFGDDFLGDAYFDKRLHEEALCLSLGLVGGKTLFLLAPNEFEKDRWVHGVGCLLYTSPSPRDRG